MNPTVNPTQPEAAHKTVIVPGRTPYPPRTAAVWVYLLLGIVFGIILTKSEVISWFRIQEMFRFHGIHMYGVLGTAIPTAMLSVQIMKRRGVRVLTGEPVAIPPKRLGRGVRYMLGGTIFGVGWALTGACPGPLFALLGSGVGVIAVSIASALLGTFTYGLLRAKLPH